MIVITASTTKSSSWAVMEKDITTLLKDSPALRRGTYVSPLPSSLFKHLFNPSKCYWSLQDGNETSNWVDALLTPAGIAEAEKANKFWASLLKSQKIPAPESYYSSPMRRCCATASVTFTGLDLPKGRPFIPTVKELFREVNGAHTCDKSNLIPFRLLSILCVI